MYHGEKLNSITHLIGAVLALVGFGALLTISIQLQSWRHILSFSVFGVTLILLYTMSTLYHSFHPPKLKRLFQKLDHIAIYLLIAGTYTPYMLVSLQDDGMLMLAVVWSLALVGLLLDALVPKRIVWLQVIIYLVMGWVCTVQYSALQAAISEVGVAWLTAGGLAYTVGIVFYLLGNVSNFRHAHGIWHLFVLMGSLCHFISIVGYVR
ncbi:hemolysin III family protein [Dasania marina]|uniref:PAQR family membrane homeostasis protein TrhA n=1 Tax=Dasania marina TaxID=471499 RepID=UPI0030DD02AD|tara:strand:- start:9373 stop:9996 length:624 start_codon:yes stop_codon:yes gene_type:complete